MAAGHQSPEYRPFGRSFSPMSVGTQPSSFNPSRPKPERNFHEIIRMKAERRAEIERRCLNLDPPLRASTLTYMDAFNAAVQIPMLLNHNAWDVLKPRLLAQRADAERKEAEQAVAAPVLEAAPELGPKQEEPQPTADGTGDRIWDDIQKPARDKIKDYADEYIASIWADGRAINKATSGKFAADVLLHVRRRFYEVVAEQDDSLSAQQMTIPHDSPLQDMRKLKLEDMKWIFEEAIRPHTERFGREIFLCSACDAGAKRFSFDAVIQHYAAKHTSALSHGNAVVYWKADWPAEPPFHPSPDTIWNHEPDHRPPFTSQYASSPPYFPNPTASWMSPMHMPPGQPNGLYHMQSEELVSAVLQIWDATQEIRDLSDSVRLYVIIHHVAMRLTQRFTNEPPLSMFADCINHNPALRAIKDLQGLQCKSCRAFGTGSGQTPFPQDVPMYSASELFDHFQRTHVELDARTPQRNFARPLSMSSMDAPRMDWKFDMIELPHESTIRNLMYSPGINLQKLQTVSSVLPHYFPVPLPPIEPIPFDASRSSRPPSNLGRITHDDHHDDRRIYGMPPTRGGPPPAFGDRPHDPSREWYGKSSTNYEHRYAYDPHNEPRRYTEVLPRRDIAYLERPSATMQRIEYVDPPDRYEGARFDYGGAGGEIYVSRRRLQQRDAYEDQYTRPGPRYSPVVDESPRPPGPDARDVVMDDHYDPPIPNQGWVTPVQSSAR